MPSSILKKAEEIVNGSRKQDYGSATESFSKIATIASIITGKTLTPQDCCKVLIAVKLTRESFKHQEDNLLDACGYLELLNRLCEEQGGLLNLFSCDSNQPQVPAPTYTPRFNPAIQPD